VWNAFSKKPRISYLESESVGMWARRRKPKTLSAEEVLHVIDAAGMMADDLADEMQGARQTS
jgi:hypothetical protein